MADEKFKVTQLKTTVNWLNLPLTDDKATLMKRLYSCDLSGAWKKIARSVQREENRIE